MFFVDAHCDTVTTAMSKNEKLFKNSCHIDFDRLLKFENPIQVFSIWLNNELLCKPFENTLKAISFLKNEVSVSKNYINIVETHKDIVDNIRQKKVSAILGIEGGEAIEGDISKLEKLYSEGVRVLTLTWNRENELGYGAATKSEYGLKKFGFEVMEFINANKIIADISHLNEKGIQDVFEVSEKPFIASHSNCFEICKNARNLKDEQIKAIAEKGGVIGINMYPPFILEKSESRIEMEDVFLHIDHIIKKVGDDFIGIGCDFDGIDKTLSRLRNILDLEYFFEELFKRYGQNTAEKIIYKNFMRIFIEI